MLLIITISAYILQQRPSWKFLWICIGILISVVAFSLIIDLLLSNTKLQRGFDTPRFAIWFSLINDVSIKSLLYGMDLNTIPEIAAYNGNPHNSFLALYSSYGLIGMLFASTVLAA